MTVYMGSCPSGTYTGVEGQPCVTMMERKTANKYLGNPALYLTPASIVAVDAAPVATMTAPYMRSEVGTRRTR